MNWLYDSHIHLSDPEYKSEIPHIITAMELLKLKACCVSMDYDTSVSTLNLSKKSQNILPFIGIHPEMAQKNTSLVFEMIEKKNKEISGIGEIGLDRKYISSDDEWNVQKKVFSNQLSLAEKFNKPVSIHSRKTLDQIFEIMSSFSIRSVLLHWFDGNKNQLNHAMDLGFYVSYGPVLIYAGDKQVLLHKTDTEKILVETDSPFLAPEPMRGKKNEPSFIKYTIDKLAHLKGISFDEINNITTNNFNSLFFK